MTPEQQQAITDLRKWANGTGNEAWCNGSIICAWRRDDASHWDAAFLDTLEKEGKKG